MNKEIFCNSCFVQRLREAASITKEKGVEAGFAVIEFKGKTSFEKIITGLCDYIRLAIPDPDKADEVCNIHFHPSSSGPISPSRGDLASLIEDEEEGVPVTSIGIGQVNGEGDISLLVIDKGKSDIFSIRDAQEEIEKLSFFCHQDEVIEVLKKAGFNFFFLFWPRL